MRKIVFFALFFLLLSITVHAAEPASVSFAKLEELTKTPFATPILGGSIASGNGKIFFVTRNLKTRKLYWHIYSPDETKITAQGDCPFMDYSSYSVSENGSNALVYSKFPPHLWHLDINKCSWKKVYTNPPNEKAGLAMVIPITFFSFINDTEAMAILDNWNAKHAVTDSIIAKTTLSPFSIKPVNSLWKVKDKAVDVIMGGKKAQEGYKSELLKYGNNGELFFVVTNDRLPSQKGYVSYLFYHGNNTPVLLTKSNDKLIPLDFNQTQKLYTEMSLRGGKTFIASTGKGNVIMDKPALAGKLLSQDKIGLYVKEGNQFNLYVGNTGAWKKLASFAKPYPVAFLQNKPMVLVLKDSSLSYYKY